MKAYYKRKKGAKLELQFAKMIRQYGLDAKAKRMVLSGADWAHPTDIYTKLPFSFECKNQEKVRIWEWFEEARTRARINKPPVLVFTSNFRPIMVCVEAETFLDILAEKL